MAEANRRSRRVKRWHGEAYARAGFEIHLDASSLAWTIAVPLSGETIAARAAVLCTASGRRPRRTQPVYVLAQNTRPGGRRKADRAQP